MMCTCYSLLLCYRCYIYKSTKRRYSFIDKMVFALCCSKQTRLKFYFLPHFEMNGTAAFFLNMFFNTVFFFVFLHIKSKYSKINRFQCTQLCTQQYRTQCLVIYFINIAGKRWLWTHLKWFCCCFFFAMSFKTGARTLWCWTRNRA